MRRHWFPERADLDNFVVTWSGRRQKRTLASCNLKKRIVKVAKELNCESASVWLEPLLYHEMCHAVLGEDLPKSRRKTPWHGSRFRLLESRHPGTAPLDRWIKNGGWLHAVRSERARSSAKRRRAKGANAL